MDHSFIPGPLQLKYFVLWVSSTVIGYHHNVQPTAYIFQTEILGKIIYLEVLGMGIDTTSPGF